MTQSRRQSLRMIAGAAMLPALAASFPRIAAALETSFDPPAAPMLLSRTLMRSLPDGAQILIKRSWEVRFSPASRGFSLSGDQVSVEVDTPPTLEFLARLEKERIETDLFPIELTPAGIIAAGKGKPSSETFDQAIEAAAAHIARSGLPADNQRLTTEALSALQKSAAELTSALPSDLFRPRQPHWRVDRNVDLPNGLSGKVEVIFDARMDFAEQLMERCERRIVSSIGDSSRTSSETWELAHI